MRVGLTGGIGSGKSSVSRLLAEHGAVVIDADLLAREVVGPGTDGLREVVQAFGNDVVASNGTLDRPALGRLVFAEPGARSRLEAIIHPRVRARAAEIEAQVEPGAVVVHDIPLLVETGQQDSFDVVVVVDADPDVQLDRLTRQRGMAAEEATARIAAQARREDRLAAADVVVPNNGTLEQLRAEVSRAWARLTS